MNDIISQEEPSQTIDFLGHVWYNGSIRYKIPEKLLTSVKQRGKIKKALNTEEDDFSKRCVDLKKI